MDADLRALERGSETGDAIATVRLARAAERAGMPSLPLWTRALSQAPQSADARSGYICAGGFYAEPVEDGYLGPSWKLFNLQVNGEKWNLVYGRKLLQHKNHRLIERTADQHIEHSLAGPEENPGGVAMTSTLVQGSIDLAMYDHRTASFLADRVAQYQNDQFEKEKRWRIAGKLTYNGEQATLENIALDRMRNTQTVVVPELTDNHAVLAPEQPEDRLGTLAHIPDNLVPLLTELFGRDYKRVIPAIQYFTRRRSGNLSEIYLWIPSIEDRSNYQERALVLGRGDNGDGDDGFSIGCGDYVGWPACGWRSAAKMLKNRQ